MDSSILFDQIRNWVCFVNPIFHQFSIPSCEEALDTFIYKACSLILIYKACSLISIYIKLGEKTGTY